MDDGRIIPASLALDDERPAHRWRRNFPQIGTREWDVMNDRRGELIDKSVRQGDASLTDEEREEYEELQRLTSEAVSKAFPPSQPDLETLRRLEAELVKKYARPES